MNFSIIFMSIFNILSRYIAFLQTIKIVLSCTEEILKIDNENSYAIDSKLTALENLNRYDEMLSTYDDAFKIYPETTDRKSVV